MATSRRSLASNNQHPHPPPFQYSQRLRQVVALPIQRQQTLQLRTRPSHLKIALPAAGVVTGMRLLLSKTVQQLLWTGSTHCRFLWWTWEQATFPLSQLGSRISPATHKQARLSACMSTCRAILTALGPRSSLWTASITGSILVP